VFSHAVSIVGRSLGWKSGTEARFLAPKAGRYSSTPSPSRWAKALLK
jgi:hypothetical protein